MKKTCSGCGYKTDEKDRKCPICGGALYYDGGVFSPHNPRAEKEWNGGYHNDFEEGRKTGEYCDPEFEKYANGGEHYHGTPKTTAGGTAKLFDNPDMTPQAARIIAVILSLFLPVAGPFIVLGLAKGSDTEASRAAKKTAFAVLIITFILAVYYIIY